MRLLCKAAPLRELEALTAALQAARPLQWHMCLYRHASCLFRPAVKSVAGQVSCLSSPQALLIAGDRGMDGH